MGDLQYVMGLVAQDGSVSREFDTSGSLRGQVLVGLMAANLHIGLGDPQSLDLLDRVADRVNYRIESEDGVDLGFDSERFSDFENHITHLLAADFLSTHYGLTKDLRSRSNLLSLAESLEKRVGWTPATSKAAYLLQSSRISRITGGAPLTKDVQESIREYTQHYTDIIEFSARGGLEGLTTSLSKLSLLIKAAREAGLEVPDELVALWSVHIDYVVNQTRSMPITPENYPSLISSLMALVGAAENNHLEYSKVAADYALELCGSIAKMWRAGDRILFLPANVLNVYPLDPKVTVEEIVTEARKGGRILVTDLRFPTALLILERYVELPRELSSALPLAISKVSVKNGYYQLFEEGSLRSEEFVNRLWRVNFLATYLALQRAPAAQIRNETVDVLLFRHPTFIIVLTLLLSLAFARRAGLLRW